MKWMPIYLAGVLTPFLAFWLVNFLADIGKPFPYCPDCGSLMERADACWHCGWEAVDSAERFKR